MLDETLQGAINSLMQIEGDDNLSKSIKIKVKSAMASLNNKENVLNLRIDKSLEELESIADDPNLPDYTRMQIWSVVSLLESRD